VYVQVAGRLRRRHRILHVAAQAVCADDAPMMILRSSAPSPFGRKVRIALSLLGFDRDVRVEAADPASPQDSLREQNPLGKIPVLITEDGSTVYDSRVILEYLDDRAGGGKSYRAREVRAWPRCACRRCATASSMLRS
jgi:glutathione S-transferase